MSKRVHNAEAADVVDLHVRDDRRRILIETTREALHSDDERTLCLILNDQPSSDLAQVFRVLDGDDQRRTVELLGESLAAGMLGELYRASVIRVADALRDEPLSDIVDEMEPAAAADVLAKLPHDTSERVLGLMEEGEADEVRRLMSHPQDTGGGIMTSRLIAVSEQGHHRRGDAAPEIHGPIQRGSAGGICGRRRPAPHRCCLPAIDASGLDGGDDGQHC